MTVEYRTIVEYPDYVFGNDGSVWSKKSGKWIQLTPSPNGSGYLHVGLSNELGKRKHCIHVLVAEAFLGPQPSEYHWACHKDGNKLNNHAYNLKWATQGENEKDKRIHDPTFGIGVRNNSSRLVEREIREIKQKLTLGFTQKELGDEYGVSRNTIQDIANGRTWKHIV